MTRTFLHVYTARLVPTIVLYSAILETKIYTHTKQLWKYKLFTFCIEQTKSYSELYANMYSRSDPTLNSQVSVVLICYSRSKKFEFCRIVEESGSLLIGVITQTIFLVVAIITETGNMVVTDYCHLDCRHQSWGQATLLWPGNPPPPT